MCENDILAEIGKSRMGLTAAGMMKLVLDRQVKGFKTLTCFIKVSLLKANGDLLIFAL